MWFRLILLILLLRSWIYNHAERIFGHAFHAAHCSYFAAVFVEGHGLYASMGGALFILSILAVIYHLNME